MKSFDVKPVSGIEPALGLQLAMLANTTWEARDDLGRVGVEALRWQAFPGGHSIGGVLLHVIDVEAYWVERVGAKKRPDPEELKLLMADEIDQGREKWPTPPKRPLSWYYELQDRVRERTIRTVGELGRSDLASERSSGGHKMRFTLRGILSHVIQHEAYHSGQAVLLKMLHKRR
jgi:uncharacterized damage-inducible protein DinB